jgi:molecular chaperone GrpE
MAAESEDKVNDQVLNNADQAEPEAPVDHRPNDGQEKASPESVSAGDVRPEAPATGAQASTEPLGEASASPSDGDAAELKRRLLRVLADQENFRRRIERERDEAIRFAAAQLVKDLLLTADNLARALQSVPPEPSAQNEAMQNLLAGVAASERALQDTFARHGIKQIQPELGEPFDPHQHQAMFEVEADDWEPGAIAQIVLPGYAYHERLLRPAFVGVAKDNPTRPD